MNINLKQIVVSIIIFFSLNAFAENNAAKKIENYNIPDNEYYQTKKMDELENQNKELKIEIEKLNSLKIILEKFLIELSRVDENLNSKKDDSSKSDFIKSLNIYIKLNNIILNNGVNIQEEGKVAAILNGLLNQSFSLQVLGDSSQNEVIENFKSNFNNFKETVKQTIYDIPNKINECEIIKTQNETLISKISDVKQSKKSIDQLAIIMGLPAFCITILLLNLIPTYFKKTETEEDGNNQNSLDVSTVLLLTMTILILGLSKMITGEVLGTLLGGISAYVLNRNSNNRTI
jgi:hypothetical protein